MKFLADMGISPKTVEFLTLLGYDATHLHHLGLETLADADILAKALREDRIVLTHDLDFGELIAASGAKLPSVITFRLRNMHPNRVNMYMEEIVGNHQAVLEQGAAISITEGKLRVRLLPIIKEDNQD
jgi:predicted nuclease of predicted toxin-antitoxin system